MAEGYVNGHAIKTGTWTDEEDLLLLAWQQKYGNKWSKVAEHIPGRTGQQCAQRWRHKVNPNIKKDKWSEYEDLQLRRLVDKFGNKWAEIARHMDGRTDQQCMGRWTRHLDPNISRDAWKADEDTVLLELYAKHGSQWSRISKLLPGRTSQQCRQRFCQLHPELQREVEGREGRSGGTSRGSGGGGTDRPAREDRGASKRKTLASRDEWAEDEEGDEDDDEDWALEQKAFESYRTAPQRRADKLKGKEGKRAKDAPLDEEPKVPVVPIKKRGRSHSVAQPASASPGGGAGAGPDMMDDPLEPILRMDSAAHLHPTAPPDFLRCLFSPEASKPAHREARHLLMDGGHRTPLMHAGSGALEAMMPPANMLLQHPPGSAPPPSAPWKLTPTAHVFSPGFVMNTGYELPTPSTVLRKLQAAGKEGSHLDMPLYALEPLMNSPGAFVPVHGAMDTPGVLMNRPSRMPTECAPSALKSAHDLAGPSPLGALPQLLPARVEATLLPRQLEAVLGTRAGGSPPSGSGRPGEHLPGPGPSSMPAPSAPSTLAPATQEPATQPQRDAMTTAGAGSGAGAGPGLHPRASDQTFLSPTPRHRAPGARLLAGALEDPWTPSGALQPSSARPMPVSRLGAEAAPVVAAPGPAQTLLPTGKENRGATLAEKRHAVYALLSDA